MKRDTVSAFRARAKRTTDEINTELARQKTVRDEAWRAGKVAAAEKEAARHKFTRDEVLGATHVVDQFGKLRGVVRVNQKTVSVTTEWSWTETIPFDKVHGVKR